MKIKMNYLEVLNGVHKKTSMFIREKTYNCITAFITGYSLANVNVLEGFREWLTYKYEAPYNFGYHQQIKYVFNKGDLSMKLTDDDEQKLIDFLFELFFEFDKEKKEKGVKQILKEHQVYWDSYMREIKAKYIVSEDE